MSQYFDQLLQIAYRLNDPIKGCPWDIKQNFDSLQKYILEEACELVDAIDDQNTEEMIEELGDVLYVVIFYAKVAERESLFTLDDILKVLCEKLVRRHPHIFGEEVVSTSEEVEKNWKKIKSEEKKERKSLLDGIPRSLAALARAQKVLSKLMQHASFELLEMTEGGSKQEQDLANDLIKLVLKAEKEGLDAEKVLRVAIQSCEKSFRKKEFSN